MQCIRVHGRASEMHQRCIGDVQSTIRRVVLWQNQPELFNNRAQLCKLNQNMAYCLIHRSQPIPLSINKNAIINLDLIREATSNLNGSHPPNERIWLAITKNWCNLSSGVRNFLWKLIHNAHKCGNHWLKIRNFKDRGVCHNCNTTESMQHIIFNCEANHCSHAWDIVKELCSLKCIPWPHSFDITSIMALPLLKVKSENDRIRTGATHLLLIAASECAFLMWKTCCKRLFDDNTETQNKTPAPQEIRHNLITILNERLEHDHILTSWKRYQSRALPGKLVLNTWSGTLLNESSLPEDWLKANGVLVGIAKRPPAGNTTLDWSGIGWVPHSFCA